jgi:hypothetical protein
MSDDLVGGIFEDGRAAGRAEAAAEIERLRYWKRIANERLRILWIIAHANGGRFTVGPSLMQDYPGDDAAEVLTHTDPQFGDFIIEARSTDKRSEGGG